MFLLSPHNEDAPSGGLVVKLQVQVLVTIYRNKTCHFPQQSAAAGGPVNKVIRDRLKHVTTSRTPHQAGPGARARDSGKKVVD